MICLDENFPESQRLLLRSWRIRARQIGLDVGVKGMSDTAIIALLSKTTNITFVSLDDDFFRQNLARTSYCLVVINTGQVEAASFTRRVMSHSSFNTWAKRGGKVLRVSQSGIVMFQAGTFVETRLHW